MVLNSAYLVSDRPAFERELAGWPGSSPNEGSSSS